MAKSKAQIFKEGNQNFRVDFDDVKFNSKIQEKGLNVIWEKMSVCPCRKDINSQAVIGCINCNGTGWYYFDPIKIKALISGAQFSRNFVMWSENLVGSIMVTVDPVYKVGWNDKLTIVDAETVFSEVKQIKILNEDDDKKSIILRYKPTQIISVYSFIDEETKLKKIENEKIIQNENILTINDDELKETDNLSIVYYYNPVYLITDNLNDYRNTYKKNKNFTEELTPLPIKVMAKKLHLVLV